MLRVGSRVIYIYKDSDLGLSNLKWPGLELQFSRREFPFFWIRNLVGNKALFSVSVADSEPNLDPDPPDPHVFGPPDPDPDPLVRGMDPDSDQDPIPDPDPSIIKQK
jgi:hypothetical protein